MGLISQKRALVRNWFIYMCIYLAIGTNTFCNFYKYNFQMFLPEPPVSPWATVLPLVLVMGVCMVKQAGDNGDGDVDSGRKCVISVVFFFADIGDSDGYGNNGGDMMLDVHCDIVIMLYW